MCTQQFPKEKTLEVGTPPPRSKFFSQNTSVVREKRSQWEVVEQEDGVNSPSKLEYHGFLRG